MVDKVLKKTLPYLKIQWVLVYNIFVMLCASISLLLMTFYEYEIGETQILFWLQGSHILAIVASIISCLILLMFHKRIAHLFDTIKAIADGEFMAVAEQKNEDNYGEAYQNLNRVVEELKGSKEEMEQFTNEFLHEIKTPLTAIHGFAELLIDTGEQIESPERMKYLQIISDESIRLSELSQNTLLLAKMDACQIVTDKVEYDLGEQIKKCIILFLSQIEEKEITLHVDVENLMYYSNKEFMEQVWINLISNAIKFTPAGGTIEIKGVSDEEGITLTFTDNGPGMDEETKQHIFEKFYQGSCGRKMGGNGIGLSIVHRIITLCNGRIEVISDLGKGTTFKIQLPNK